jgi:hypothetical protein
VTSRGPAAFLGLTGTFILLAAGLSITASLGLQAAFVGPVAAPVNPIDDSALVEHALSVAEWTELDGLDGMTRDRGRPGKVGVQLAQDGPRRASVRATSATRSTREAVSGVEHTVTAAELERECAQRRRWRCSCWQPAQAACSAPRLRLRALW